jgi:hypothetical protein
MMQQFFEAIKSEDSEAVKKILTAQPHLVNEKDLRGSTPKLIATSKLSGNLAVAISFNIAIASLMSYSLFASTFSRALRIRFDNLDIS